MPKEKSSIKMLKKKCPVKRISQVKRSKWKRQMKNAQSKEKVPQQIVALRDDPWYKVPSNKANKEYNIYNFKSEQGDRYLRNWQHQQENLLNVLQLCNPCKFRVRNGNRFWNHIVKKHSPKLQ